MADVLTTRDAARDKTSAPLLRSVGISKTYRTPDHIGRLVLERVDFTLRDGEIVAILGKSGAGKSTFLRILAGLVEPSEGRVEYRGMPVEGPVRGIAMVFQSFALFPWLTVLGNVELGLEAQGVPAAERRRRAVEAIDQIGLDGFENAYPKELSGGMRQRVGFARALVVKPDILLLDEPFSQLDVLTAETLRNDLTELWVQRRIPTKGIVLVSHNIEEAVEMADRILIFGSDPGRITAEVRVPLPRPRDWESPAFRQIVDQVYTLLTTVPGRDGRRGAKPEPIGIGHRLPDAAVQQFSGLIERLTEPPYNGRADLPQLADEENLDMDELFPMIEALQLLGFAQCQPRRYRADPGGPRLCGGRHARAQADIRRRPAEEHPAGGAYQAGARRASRPSRAGRPLPARTRGSSVGGGSRAGARDRYRLGTPRGDLCVRLRRRSAEPGKFLALGG